jgi:hypothetical protein
MPGGPGVSTLYSITPGTFLASIRTFFNALAAYIPADVTLKFPGAGDTIDSATGSINGAWAESPPANVTCANANVYNAAGGALLHLQTGDIVNRRRVVGRLFLVPWGAYQSDGTILDAAVTAANTAAATLLNSGNFVVWHRPTSKGASDGTAHTIIGGTVPDFATVLRSRRD